MRESYNIDRILPNQFVPGQNLKNSFDAYRGRIKNPGPYIDRHYSVLFGGSFELMVRDLIFIGLLNFGTLEVSETCGNEFFVHLRKTANPETGEKQFYATRALLLNKVHSGLGPLGYKTLRSREIFRFGHVSSKTLPGLKELARKLSKNPNTLARDGAENKRQIEKTSSGVMLLEQVGPFSKAH